ncbi:hypothetical protein [Spartinivicinus poritis]|uniref:Uncharacterized protein n=1 Tax=Spartinivicinus poritis TaxID=2994640 RepID=A0ABT5UJW7_9GAMM|nr:hypothetical protein [Spartinivicinus sp. A2-2]MDE1465807.1 hypothetical protein [Spartinivicinus sp. A2-2]
MTVIPLRRREATVNDYEWSTVKEKYVLTFDNRSIPGVIAESPEEGVRLYNAYIQELDSIYSHQQRIVELIKVVYQQCTQDAVGNLSSSVYANVILHSVDKERYQLKRKLIAKLNSTEMKIFLDLACNTQLIYQTLSYQEIKALASMYC